MNGHTPGTWRMVPYILPGPHPDQDPAARDYGFDVVVDREGFREAKNIVGTHALPGGGDFDDLLNENEANCRLIAAAPDLLAACRAMIAWDDAEKAGPDYGTQTRDTHPSGEAIWRTWWDNQRELCRLAFDTARAAISKATGGQP